MPKEVGGTSIFDRNSGEVMSAYNPRVISIDYADLAWWTLTPTNMDEILSAGFVVLCFLFMITAAVLLLINRICAIDYLRMQEIFWLTQFTGYWIFRLIMKQITEYAKMDLYGRFIKVFGYDLTPCFMWGMM